MIIPRTVLLIMRNISDNKNIDKIKTYVLCSILFFFSKIMPCKRLYGKARQATVTVQYDTCALHAG